MKSRRDYIYYIIIALLTLLPSTSIFNILRLLLVAFIFVSTNDNELLSIKIRDTEFIPVMRIMIISPWISMAVSAFLSFGDISYSLFFHEYSRIIFNIMVIIIMRRLTVTYKLCYAVSIIVLFINFGVQLLEYSNNAFIFDFLEKYYLSTDTEGWNHLQLALAGERFGSIYINPNVYIIVLMVALNAVLEQDRRKANPFNYVCLIVIFLSCVLTGSRTALVAMLVILTIYFIRYASIGSKFFLLIIVTIGLTLYTQYFSAYSRVFELESDDMGSLTTKFMAYIWYWNSSNPIYWFTGSIGTGLGSFDSEYGHIYGWYGVIGIYWYVLLTKYFANVNNDKFISLVSVIAFVLVGTTSSVFLGFSVFTFFASYTLVNKVEHL